MTQLFNGLSSRMRCGGYNYGEALICSCRILCGQEERRDKIPQLQGGETVYYS